MRYRSSSAFSVANSTSLRQTALVSQPPAGATQDTRLQNVGFVILGGILAFDNFPATFGVAGLTTGSPSLIAILLLSLMLPGSRSRLERAGNIVVVSVLTLGVLSALTSAAFDQASMHVLTAHIGNDTILAKGLKTLAIVLFWLLSVRVGFRLYRSNQRALAYIGLGLLGVSAVILAAQTFGFSSSGARDWAHAVGWHEGRPRGFKFESSVFGGSLLAASALASLLLPNRIVWGMMVPLTIGLAYLSTSRGALLAAIAGPLIVIVGTLFKRAASRIATSVFASVLATGIFVAAFMGYYIVSADVWGPLAAAGSDATRSGWGLVALRGVTEPPLGLNLFNYWYDVQPIIARTYLDLQANYAGSDLQEFANLAFSTSDSGLSPKSLPAVFAVWFGVPGMALAVGGMTIATTIAIWKSSPSQNGLAVGASTVVFALATFVPGIFIYEMGLIIGAALAATAPPEERTPRIEP